MRKLISLGIVIGLLTLLAVIPVAAGGHAGDPPGLAKAIAAQEAHTDALLATDGVVGTGVGLASDGKHQVLIFTESAGVAGLPKSLDRVKVRVIVTGKIVLAHHLPGHCGGPPNQRPVGCDEGGNAVPTADGQSVSTPEETDLIITLTGSDADGCGATFTFTITQSPTPGSLGAIGGVTCDLGNLSADVTYDPEASGPFSNSFDFTIDDGTDTSNTATVSITVGTVSISFPRPANIGTSSDPDELIISGGLLFCTGGTLDAVVSAGSSTYALTYPLVAVRTRRGLPPSSVLCLTGHSVAL